MRQVIQQALIKQLEADCPLLVVYAQTELALSEWDGVPQMVRLYDGRQYILSHHRPFADVHGQTIYVLDTANVPDPKSSHLPLSTPLITTDPCPSSAFAAIGAMRRPFSRAHRADGVPVPDRRLQPMADVWVGAP